MSMKRLSHNDLLIIVSCSLLKNLKTVGIISERFVMNIDILLDCVVCMIVESTHLKHLDLLNWFMY